MQKIIKTLKGKRCNGQLFLEEGAIIPLASGVPL